MNPEETKEPRSYFFQDKQTTSYKSYLMYTLQHKFQILYMVIFLLTPFWIIPFIKKFLWIVNYGQVNSPPNYRWPHFTDIFSYSVIFAICSHIIEKLTVKVLYPIYIPLVKKRHFGQIRQEKALKMASLTFKSSYYIFACVVGYLILKDAEFTPSYLLGHGQIELSLKGYPYITNPKFLETYFLMGIGLHIQQLYAHALSKPRNDFFEMLLHHFVTVLLMSLAYMTNYTTYSSLILFLHDWADIFTGLARIASETDKKTLTFVFYLGILASWFYTRIFVLPFIVIPNLYVFPVGIEGDTSAYFCMFLLLCILQFLHVYWFILFLKMGFRYIKFNEAENLQSKIEEIPEEKEKRSSRKVIYS